MTTRQIVDYGERAFLIELGDLGEVMAVAERFRALVQVGGPWSAVRDVVPAAETVLVTFNDPVTRAEVRRLVERWLPTTVAEGAATRMDRKNADTVEIPVSYDGPDLDEVAGLVGLTVPEVIAAHTGRAWRAAFGGFAPGFTYLTGGDPRLVVPRLHEPRTAVPKGAVALAGIFSGVYPRDTPGGWRVLGRTDAVVWDLDRHPPALLRPGVRVRFVQVA